MIAPRRSAWCAGLVAGVFLCAHAIAAPAPTAADLGAQLDALVARHYPADRPGAAVLVRKGDQVLLRKGYGRASLDPAVAVAPEMVFAVGSITKQFTAAAIMLLVDAGKVSLGDDLRKWVPEYPDHGHRVTVEHLLTHTSGVPSFTEQPSFQAQQDIDLTHDQVLAFFKDLPLAFTPGTKWAYSNSGYYLLGMIVEKASGQSYGDFMTERIFRPLGMEHTSCGERGPALPGGVRGYDGSASPPKEPEPPIQSHTGAIVGFASSILRIPDEQVVVTILCNSLPQRSGLVGLPVALAAITIGKPIVNPPVFAVKQAMLDPYTGVYAHPSKPRLAVRHLGNQLLLQPSGSSAIVKPQPASDTAFFIRGTLARFSFLRDARSGRVTGMESRNEDGTVDIYARTDQPLPEQRTSTAVGEAVLERYVGEYEWRPGVSLIISRQGAHLYVQAPGDVRTEIFPGGPTEFFFKVTDDELTFQADGDSPAKRLILHTNGHDLLHMRIR